MQEQLPRLPGAILSGPLSRIPALRGTCASCASRANQKKHRRFRAVFSALRLMLVLLKADENVQSCNGGRPQTSIN